MDGRSWKQLGWLAWTVVVFSRLSRENFRLEVASVVGV